MQAITTSVIKRGGKKYIVAKTASGKTSTLQVDTLTPPESDHRTVAKRLGVRLGFEGELIGGEVKNGFAYVPFSGKVSFTDLEKAVTCLIRAAAAFPEGEKDPIRLAAGIIDLVKEGVVK